MKNKQNEWLHRVSPKAYLELAFGFAGAPDMPEVQHPSRTLSLTLGDDAAAAKAGPTMPITEKTRARVAAGLSGCGLTWHGGDSHNLRTPHHFSGIVIVSNLVRPRIREALRISGSGRLL